MLPACAAHRGHLDLRGHLALGVCALGHATTVPPRPPPFKQSLAVALPEVWEFCARACQPNFTSTSTRHTTQLDTTCKPIHISTTTHTRTRTPFQTHRLTCTDTCTCAHAPHTHTLCQTRALILSMNADSVECCFVSRVCSALCQGNVYLQGLSQSLSSLYLCS